LTLTSITTVGYGDLSAATFEGRAATTLIVYVGGIFLVGKVAGDFFEYKVNRREMMKQGKWSWDDLRDHTVIIGTNEDTEHHLRRLVAEFERHDATAGNEIVLISESFGDALPPALDALGVRYVSGAATAPENLTRAGVARASVIVALAADDGDVRSDGLSFDLIHRIREVNTSAQLVAECVDDHNRERLRAAGASLVARPVRAYPEMIVGALLNPGVNEVLENLFTASGETIRRIEEPVEDSWMNIVSTYVSKDRGLPIAYLDEVQQKIITAPPSKQAVKTSVLFVLID
jgi:voltage-gated potassium channel